jgi:hypothetical protein
MAGRVDQAMRRARVQGKPRHHPSNSGRTSRAAPFLFRPSAVVGKSGNGQLLTCPLPPGGPWATPQPAHLPTSLSSSLAPACCDSA